MVEAMLTRDYNTHIIHLQNQMDVLKHQQQQSKEAADAVRLIEAERVVI